VVDNPDVSLEGEMKVDPGVSITDVLYINVITNVPVSTDSIVISVFANSPCVRFPSVTISPTAHVAGVTPESGVTVRVTTFAADDK